MCLYHNNPLISNPETYIHTQSIIHQITIGKLDNAVQAAHFINDIFPSPVTPQTVRNALKEKNFHSVVKQK